MDLLISQNFHVHAFVYAENWRAISDIIVEGGVYIITSFYTKMATGTFRPTRSKIVINFSNSKRVEKVPGDDFIIPNHKFDFIDVSDLHNTAESYEDLEKQDFAAENGNWSYVSCIGCVGEVFKQEGKYKCNCGTTSPVDEKRYKVVVLAGDETEALNFVLLDRPASQIVEQTTTKLISDNLQVALASGYLAKIRDMIGKEYTFDVEIKK
ncbi:hypothetical protein ACET3Z_001150 [Daucus carota]